MVTFLMIDYISGGNIQLVVCHMNSVVNLFVVDFTSGNIWLAVCNIAVILNLLVIDFTSGNIQVVFYHMSVVVTLLSVGCVGSNINLVVCHVCFDFIGFPLCFWFAVLIFCLLHLFLFIRQAHLLGGHLPRYLPSLSLLL